MSPSATADRRLARSTRLKNQLLTGWTVMVPACLMYLVILAVLL